MSSHHQQPRPYSDNVYQPVQHDPSDDEDDERETRHGDNSTRQGKQPSSSGSGARAANGNRGDPHDPNKTTAIMADDAARVSKHLTRIQVITPLAILLNIAALGVCSVVIQPGLGAINEMHVTQFTPNGGFIALYWAVLFLFQIGFAVLAVAGRKDFTRRTIAYGVGVRLALANLFLGGWAITWVVNTHISFIAGLVLLSINGLVLLTTSLLLAAKYPASSSRPFDWLLIHAPVKMFLVITLQLDIPQMLFMALGWDIDRRAPKDGGLPLPGRPGDDSSLYTILQSNKQPDIPEPGTPAAAHLALWPSFGIIAGMGAFSAIWIFAASDFTWAVCGIYLHFALLYSRALPLDKRPPEIVAAIILAMLLQAVAFIGSIVHRAISPAHQDEQEHGRIALGRNPQEEAAAARQEAEAEAAAAAARERALAHSSRASLTSADGAEGSADPSALEHGEAGGAHNVKVSRTLGSPSKSSRK